MIDQIPYDIQALIASNLNILDTAYLGIVLRKRFDFDSRGLVREIITREEFLSIDKSIHKTLNINFVHTDEEIEEELDCGVRQEELMNFVDVYSISKINCLANNVSMLGNLVELSIRGTNVDDVSALWRLRKLDCSDTRVRDVSMLGRLDYLNCSGNKLVDVSALGKVGCLNCSFNRIEDVSALGEVVTLNCGHNTRITDVSTLGNVEILDIACTSVSDVSMLTNVIELNIKYTRVTHVGMLLNLQVLRYTGSRVLDVDLLIGHVEYFDNDDIYRD